MTLFRPHHDAQARGKWAEDTALKHLKKQGMKLVARNWQIKAGELDLVMLDGPVLVFVEVRLRSSDTGPSALESVGPAKRRRMTLAAQAFLKAHPAHSKRACRFDVVAFEGKDPTPRVTPHAFSL